MASKTVTISPTGAATAGCTATCGSYYTGSKPSSYGGTRYFTNYQATATTALGWTFVRWEVTYRYTYSDGGSPSEETVRYSANPFPATTTATDTENPFEFEDVGYSATPAHSVKKEIVGIIAVFTGGHTPTHLLVNSSTAENPAKLVYDPASHLLVADY